MKKILFIDKENSNVVYLSDIEENFGFEETIKCREFVLISTFDNGFDWMCLDDFIIRSRENFRKVSDAIEWLKGYLNVTNDDFYLVDIKELLK